jgi:hypothetical protein
MRYGHSKKLVLNRNEDYSGLPEKLRHLNNKSYAGLNQERNYHSLKEQLEPQNAHLQIYMKMYEIITEQKNACYKKMSNMNGIQT